MAPSTSPSSATDTSNDNVGNIIPPPKPSRPLTEYHIFSQLERNYILQTSSKSTHIDPITQFPTDDIDPHASSRPPKYRSLILPKEWHTKGSRPKCRSKRKVHGKISFVEMTKLIAHRWKNECDAVTREYCKSLAMKELKRYRDEMKDYVERYGEAGLRAAKKQKREQKSGSRRRGVNISKNVQRQEQDSDGHADAKKRPVQDKKVKMPLKSHQQPSATAAAAASSQGHGVPPPPLPQNMSEMRSSMMQSSLHYMQQQHQHEHNLLMLQQQQLQQQKYAIECQQNHLLKLQLQNQMNMTNMGTSLSSPTQGSQIMFMNNMMPQQANNAMSYQRSAMMMPMPSQQQYQIPLMTTVKDQGPLPPLFEDEVYCNDPFLPPLPGTCGTTQDHDCIESFGNQCYPPQGVPQDLPQGSVPPSSSPKLLFEDGFDSPRCNNRKHIIDDTPALPSFDDCPIIDPMGNMMCPKSPSISPSLDEKQPSSDDEEGSPSTNITKDSRSKSISPMPEYNIAPEVSFLAKNFVNEFSRYLNHDHEVQKQSDTTAIMDHQGMEKQALNDVMMKDGATSTTAKDGSQVNGGSTPNATTNKQNHGKDNAMYPIFDGMEYCVPLNQSKAHHNPDFSKPSPRLGYINKPQQGFDDSFKSNDNYLFDCKTKNKKRQLDDGYDGDFLPVIEDGMSRNNSGDFAAWLSDVLV